jgi:hypothetical protein
MHLLNAHSINKNGPIPAEERQDTSRETQFPPVDREQFKVLLVKWVASSNQPFLEVENPDFRNLMNFLNCRVLEVLPDTHVTMRKWVMDIYTVARKNILEKIRQSPFRFHWTFDLWTSPNQYPILGIIAHWMTVNGKNQASLLSMRVMQGANSGEKQGAVFWDLIRETGLEKKNRIFYAGQCNKQ